VIQQRNRNSQKAFKEKKFPNHWLASGLDDQFYKVFQEDYLRLLLDVKVISDIDGRGWDRIENLPLLLCF
jgi:hypothetical protein